VLLWFLHSALLHAICHSSSCKQVPCLSSPFTAFLWPLYSIMELYIVQCLLLYLPCLLPLLVNSVNNLYIISLIPLSLFLWLPCCIFFSCYGFFCFWHSLLDNSLFLGFLPLTALMDSVVSRVQQFCLWPSAVRSLLLCLSHVFSFCPSFSPILSTCHA